MNGYYIKDMLRTMRLVLCNNTNQLESGYFESERGVPCVWVIVKGKRYQFTYFGKGKFFRIWDAQQGHIDIEKRNDVISHFRALNGKYTQESIGLMHDVLTYRPR